jgi:cellulose synthase/poly-beta-1,6-N-acetylglucosamine synthase-like glycosyltransferase
VEDLKLGLDLASAGSPPMFLPSAVVTSTFPTTARGAEVQRHRWEQGHIGLILSRTPGLLYQAAKTRNIDQFALALDLMVPPLSLFGVVLFFIMAVATLAIFFGGSVLPFIASTLCVIMALAATMLAWLYFGRDILPLSSFALIAQYSFAKMKLYRAVILGRRISRWVRADRT